MVQIYANTITQFATTALPEGSPLRTMYLLMARQPQEVFKTVGTNSVLLDKWRSNLSAILAAASNPQERRVAAELGDRLWAVNGKIEAAHCCYLLADLSFGPYDNPSSRIVLLGADHKRKRASSTTVTQQGFPSHFAVNVEAIQRSEIYEWSKTLGNSQYVLSAVHPYKLLYAELLADLGFSDMAVQYVHQLSAAVRAHKGGSQLFTPHYLYQLDTFEERLRGTGAAKSLAASGSWLPRMLSKGFSRFLSSDKPSSTSSSSLSTPSPSPSDASKKSGSKSYSRPVPALAPVVPPPVAATAAPSKEEEDYASAFSNKPAKKNESIDENKDGKEGKDGDNKGKEGEGEQPQQGSRFSRLAFWKKSGNQAKLGEENAFEYNAELKMWVEKGKPLPEPEAPLPLPPTTSFHTSPPPSQDFSMPPMGTPPPGTPPMGAGGYPPPGTPPMGAGGYTPGGENDANKFTGGRRKPRYFDSLNEQVYSNANTSGRSTPSATPEKGNVKIFTPFTPPPSVFTPSPPQDPPQEFPPQ